MVFNYQWYEWLLFFFYYCTVGWALESTIISLSEKKVVNRGFLRIPMIPIYGFGAITILFSTLAFSKWPVAVYFVGLVSATVLEYFVGTLMEAIFKMKYWDYTEDFMNLKGRICLKSSLFWGFLSLMAVYFIHPTVADMISGINDTVEIVLVIIISLIFIYDTIYSVHAALDSGRILKKLDEVKTEIMELTEKLRKETEEHIASNPELQKRIDKLTAEEIAAIRQYRKARRRIIEAYPRVSSSSFKYALGDVRDWVEDQKAKLEETKDKIVETTENFSENISNKISNLKK